MKVVHLAKFYPPEWGGMERVTFDLVEGMAQHGITSRVIAFTRDQAAAGTCQHNEATVTRCHLTASPANQPISFEWIWHSIKAGAACDALIVHAPNFLALPALAFLALLRFLRRGPRHRIVLWHSDVVNKGLFGVFMRPLEFGMAALATTVVSTSPAYAASSPVLKQFSRQVVIIPLGIEPADDQGAPPHLNSELESWLKDRQMVLAVGRLVPYKGFDVLVDSARTFVGRTGSCCVIVGTGPEHNRLQQQITMLSLSDSVRVVGPLSASELDALYRRSTLFCMSSRERSEAFGVVLLEAMSHGKPIIATRICGSGVPWVAGPESSLQVNVGDAKALSDAVERLLTDGTLARRLGAAALRRFNSHFSRTAMVDSFVRLLTGRVGDR